MRQEGLSFQVGRGFEHQLPHLYSQVGVGVTVYVDVQREAVVLVVEVVGGGGGVEELLEVLDVCNFRLTFTGRNA